MNELRVIPTNMAFRGAALARVENQVVFVEGGIPGEEARVEVVEQKRRYLRARVKEIVSPSPHRVVAPCPYFGECGGCQWQHVAYAAQLEYKTSIVRDQLRRLGGLADAPVRPALGMSEPWGYRNHARFSVDGRGNLGFTRPGTHDFLRIDQCLIMHARINAVLAALQGRGHVKHQLAVRVGVNSGELLVNPRVLNEGLPFETGQLDFCESLLGRRFRVRGPSFFQVNTLMAERMIEWVRDKLALLGTETIVDAYCGVGTFGILLAPYAARVIGIEEAASAVKDARRNAEGLTNIEFVQGKTEQVLPTLQGRVDAVVLDPPRAGCRPRVIKALLDLRPQKLVYVSCDPATLARDVKALVAGGYHLVETQPADQFPQTYHIECLALLESR